MLEVLDRRELSRYRFDSGEDAEPSKVAAFERSMELFLGSSKTLAVNSGTSALFLALVAAGVGPGDEVLTPGYTFIASLSAIVHARAVPVLVEIDDSLTLDPEDVRRKITSRTRAIMAVHMLGAPCAMDVLQAIAREHGLIVIEDVAQACGGSHGGRRLGTWGNAGAFSLNTYKMITAGEGGLLATQDPELYERAFALHDQGFRPFRAGAAHAPDAPFGLNLKMAELCGAVALAQSRKLPMILERVRSQRQAFADALGDVPRSRPRRLNDEAGDCGTVLVHLYDDAATAAAVATALGTRPLLDSGRHYYGAMPALANRRAWNGSGCPFDCSAHPARSWDYAPGSLPRTDDVLSRSVALSVGVSDSYLGTAFGIDVTSDANAIAEAAASFHRLTRAALAPA